MKMMLHETTFCPTGKFDVQVASYPNDDNGDQSYFEEQDLLQVRFCQACSGVDIFGHHYPTGQYKEKECDREDIKRPFSQ